VLIISYESFLKHHAQINRAPALDVLICDEGHRLKNTGGTKTQAVLQQCRARRRLLLTGTPIQNDLEELFALVDFVCPGYLGSFSAYKTRFAQPIMRLKELLGEQQPADVERFCADVSPCSESYYTVRDGREATRQLQRLLSNVLLQRTQEGVLKGLLPRRLDYVVLCSMTAAQRLAYDAGVRSLLANM
jgi:SNF2 family DNA or RNA helicase